MAAQGKEEDDQIIASESLQASPSQPGNPARHPQRGNLRMLHFLGRKRAIRPISQRMTRAQVSNWLYSGKSLIDGREVMEHLVELIEYFLERNQKPEVTFDSCVELAYNAVFKAAEIAKRKKVSLEGCFWVTVNWGIYKAVQPKKEKKERPDTTWRPTQSQWRFIKENMPFMTEVQRQTISLLASNNWSTSLVAKIEGKTKQSVQTIRKQALRKIAKASAKRAGADSGSIAA